MTRLKSAVMIGFSLVVMIRFGLVVIRFGSVVMIRFKILDKSMLSFMSYIVVNSDTSALCCPSCIHDTSFQSIASMA